jgi:amino acid adenylation domain-containing protein/non-ribosomal peptide synthase protein (TIGR01720 family)
MALLQENQAGDFVQRIASLSTEKRALLVQRLTPLSFAQQRIWVLEQLQPGSVFYNMCLPVHFIGSLNVAVLEQSLSEVFRRHEALRTIFPIIDGRAVQLVTPAQSLRMPVTDLRHLPPAAQETETQRLINAATREPFDLERGPMWRARLVELAATEHVIVLVVHHLVFDGWSRALLLREVSLLYGAYLRGETSPLDDLPMQYGAYARWQRQSLGEEVLDKQTRYWREQLGGELPVLELTPDHPRSPVRTRNGASTAVVLSPRLSDALKALSRKEAVTLFMTLLAAFQSLLYRYTGQSDIMVGTPISGRQRGETEQLIGFFVNTVVMRTGFHRGLKFCDLLSQVRETVLQAHDHQDLPFEKLVDALQPKRDMSHTPVFQVMFAFMSAPEQTIEMPAIALRPLKYDSRMAEFDLTLNLSDSESGLFGAFEYSSDLFDTGTMERMVGHYITLLESSVSDPEQAVADLQLLSAAERQQLLEWNDTARDYGREQCLHERFEAQVERAPEAVALVYEGRQMSYGELNRRANQLGHYLQGAGVGAEVLVGIMLERSLELVVGLLGVLKAGGAYVPLDPGYPGERLRLMLADAGVAVVLTQEAGGAAVVGSEVRVVSLGSEWEEIGQQSSENLQAAVAVENLAYVIYTSGSTGTPKGAMNTHRAIGNRLQWMQQRYGLGAADRVLQKTPLSFDVSVWEFFWTLLNGARLVLARAGGHQDAGYLLQLIEQEQISTLHFVPAMLQQFLGQSGVAAQCGSVRQVMCSGEALSLELQERYFAVLGAALHNLYGPTEAAVDVTSWECERGGAAGTSVPIGRAIGNVEVYVLDEQLGLAPVGVVGQLYLGGACVGRGYVRQAELTAERFIPHPYSAAGGARLYRTGDLGRYRADGNLEYVGRADQQVKLRGYRIELGEIEAVLSQHEAVREVVVVVQVEAGAAGEQQRLVAYVVTGREPSPTTSELREYLQQHLPAYMLPAAFVFLPALPLTANGKLDRSALPAPDHSRPQLDVALVFAQTPVEQRLVAIWREFLGLEQVGIHDNFFELGGDSILSIQVVARANQDGMHLTPSQLFEYQTIAELAAVADIDKTPEAEQGLVTGPVPLTPIQHWFLEQNHAAPHHFNQAVLLEVRQTLDHELLEQTVRYLVLHHDALRLTFIKEETGWRQFNVGADQLTQVLHIDLSTVTEAQQLAAIEATANQQQMSFNLAQGPLVRVVLFELGAGQPARLLVIFHHLIIDGVSWRILFQDLPVIYQQLSQGEPIVLPAKTTSFKQWAESLVAHAQSDTVRQETAFWLDDSRRNVKPLPLDNPEGVNDAAATHVISVSLDLEETRALLKEVPATYHTQINDVLLTALAQALAQWTGEASLLVEVEGHGREEIIEGLDLSRTVGWFTSVYPVHLRFEPGSDAGAALRSIKEQLRAIPERGIGYGLLRYLSRDRKIAEKLRELPNPEISFNYLGQFDQLLPESSSFGPSRGTSGSTQSSRLSRRYALEIKGGVSGGCLQLAFTYCENLHHRATIDALAKRVTEALRSIITHCLISGVGKYTPSDFPLAALDQDTLDRLLSDNPQMEDVYPLSPMQQGMLFHTLYRPEANEYFVQLSCTLQGDLDRDAFRRVWQEVVDRHAITRSSFVWENLKQSLQIVHSHVALPWQELDWRGLPVAEQAVRLKEFLRADHEQTFDLAQAPLLRFSVIRLTEQTHQFIWSHHHLLFDGWSLPLLLREVFVFYEAFHQNQTVQLERSRPYRDYIAWLSRQDMSEAEAFWRQRLAGFTAPTRLNRDGVVSRSIAPRSRKHSAQILLSNEQTNELQAFARRQQVTLNTVVQGAWALLLAHYSGEEDVIFGSTVAGRPHQIPGIERMLGLFINTLPIRVQLTAQESLAVTLQRLQVQQAQMRQFEYTPLVQVQSWSEVARGTPLFDTLLIFQNYPVAISGATQQTQQVEQRPTMEIEETSVTEQTTYPMTISVVPEMELLLRASYDPRAYEAEMVQRILEHFGNLLSGMIGKAQQPVWDVRLLSEVEEQQLLSRGTEQPGELGSGESLTELFEAQVERRPEAIALRWKEQQVSYGELNRRANQLGRYLRRLGVGPEALVAIALERSIEMVVSLLGVLKAGGAYVPIDLEYPQERVKYMLADTAPVVLLTYGALPMALAGEETRVVDIEKDWEKISSESSANLENKSTPDNLAYVIYTSGSTGRPKGVMIEHHSMLNFLASMQRQPGLSEEDVFVAVTTLSFDIAGLELFLPLITGAQVVIATRAEKMDAKALAQRIAECRATVMQATPATWRTLIESQWRNAAPLKILCGGEALERELANQLSACGESWNLYGPTETTVWSSTHKIEAGEQSATVSLGRPIANMAFYIVDERMHLLPAGIAGELLIGGAGVARGYLNRPDLTAERFVASTFTANSGERLYRTGDSVRWDASGGVEYLGRLDFQVKIRGYRIETGEIEAVLVEHEKVRQAVVIAQDDVTGEKQLVGYLLTEGGHEVSTSEMRRHLGEHLPDYMIPRAFIRLDEWPLTVNGKLDRKALPAPDRNRPLLEKEFVAPRTPGEKVLAGIWSEVLGVAEVGIHDNFFELGGHSLLATTVISRIRSTFLLELPLRSIFETPTIAGLDLVLKRSQEVKEGFVPAVIKRIEPDSELELLDQLDELSEEQLDSMLSNLSADLEVV